MLAPQSVESMEAPPLGLGLEGGGDVNGDGVDDLLNTTLTIDPMPFGKTELRLLVGGGQHVGR